MEAKRIEVVKDWPKPISVYNIQVFLGFANFYWQFIQGFSKIIAPLISMLITIRLPNKPVPSKNNGSRSASSKNDNSKPVFKKNNSNSEVNRFGVGRNSVEYTKKSGKLSKSRKSKSEKMFKSQNLAKSRKKLSNNRNSTNFNATEAGLKFLTSDAKIAFNCLQLAFTKAPILQHFNPECYIWIETDALNYAISGVLNQLTSRTNSKEIVTKTNLSQWYLIAFFLKKMIL